MNMDDISDVVSAIKVFGKVIDYADGSRLLLLSPGFEHIGQGATLVFRKVSADEPWVELKMREALPYVAALAKQVLGTEM